MAVLGIDYGTKRIGLALADGGRPHRLRTIDNGDALWSALESVIMDHDVTVVAVGLPRNLDGDDTSQTRLTSEFVDQLVARFPKLTVTTEDEADTSNQARQRLAAERINPADIERLVDAEAAAIILEDYLGE